MQCSTKSANLGKFWLNFLNLAPFILLNSVDKQEIFIKFARIEIEPNVPSVSVLADHGNDSPTERDSGYAQQQQQQQQGYEQQQQNAKPAGV